MLVRHRHLHLDSSRVTQLRAEAGIDTIRELAERAGLERSTVNKVLRRERPATVYVVGRLARALGVEVSELLAANGKEAE